MLPEHADPVTERKRGRGGPPGRWIAVAAAVLYATGIGALLALASAALFDG